MEYNHEKLLHCLAYDGECPQTCFKAKITRDYNKYADNYAGIEIPWADFTGWSGCKKVGGCPCRECAAETCVNPLVCDDYIAWVCKG